MHAQQTSARARLAQVWRNVRSAVFFDAQRPVCRARGGAPLRLLACLRRLAVEELELAALDRSRDALRARPRAAVAPVELGAGADLEALRGAAAVELLRALRLRREVEMCRPVAVARVAERAALTDAHDRVGETSGLR